MTIVNAANRQQLQKKKIDTTGTGTRFIKVVVGDNGTSSSTSSVVSSTVQSNAGGGTMKILTTADDQYYHINSKKNSNKKKLPFYSKQRRNTTKSPPPAATTALSTSTSTSVHYRRRRRLQGTTGSIDPKKSKSKDEIELVSQKRYQERPLLQYQHQGRYSISNSSSNDDDNSFTNNNNSNSKHRSFFSDDQDNDNENNNNDTDDVGFLVNDRYYQHNDSFSIAEFKKKHTDKHNENNDSRAHDYQSNVGPTNNNNTNNKSTTKVRERIRRLFTHFSIGHTNTTNNKNNNHYSNNSPTTTKKRNGNILKNSDHERRLRGLSTSMHEPSVTLIKAKKLVSKQQQKQKNSFSNKKNNRNNNNNDTTISSLDLRHVTTLGSADSVNDNSNNNNYNLGIVSPGGTSVTMDLLLRGTHFVKSTDDYNDNDTNDNDDQDSTANISTSSSTLLQIHILEQKLLLQQQQGQQQSQQTHEETTKTTKSLESNNKAPTIRKSGQSLLHDNNKRRQNQQNQYDQDNVDVYESENDDIDDDSDQDDNNMHRALPLPMQLHQQQQQTLNTNVTNNGKQKRRKQIFSKPPDSTGKSNRTVKAVVGIDPPATGNIGRKIGIDTDAPLVNEIISEILRQPPDTGRSTINVNSLVTEKINNRATTTAPSAAGVVGSILNTATGSTVAGTGAINYNQNQFTKDNLEVLNKQHKERQSYLNQQLQSLLNEKTATATAAIATTTTITGDANKKPSPVSTSSDSSLFSSLDSDIKIKSNHKGLDECVEVLAVSKGNGKNNGLMDIQATTVAKTTSVHNQKSCIVLSNHDKKNIQKVKKDVVETKQLLQKFDYDTDTEYGEDNRNNNSSRMLSTTVRKQGGGQTDKAVLATIIKSGLSRPFGRSTVLEMLKTHKLINVTVSTAEWNQENQKWMYTISVHRNITSQQPLLSSSSPSSPTKPYNSKSQMDNKERGNVSVSSPSQSYLTTTCTRSVSDFIWLERALRYEFHGALLIPPLVVMSQSDNNQSLQMPVAVDVLKHWLSDTFNGIRGCGEVILQYSNSLSSKDTIIMNQQQAEKNRTAGMIHYQEEKKDDQGIVLPSDSGDNSLIDERDGGGGGGDKRHFDLFMNSESIETFLYRKSDSLDDVDIFARFGILGATTMTAAAAATRKAAAAADGAEMCYNKSNCNNFNANKLLFGCTASNVDNDDDDNDDQPEPTLFQTLIGRAAMLSPLELCIGPSPLNPTMSMDYQQYDMRINDIPKEVIQLNTKKVTQQQKNKDQQYQSGQQMDINKNRNNIFANRGLPLDVLSCSSRVIGPTPSVDVQDSVVDFAPSTVSSLTSMNHGHAVGVVGDERNDTGLEIPKVDSAIKINPATSSSALAVHSELIEAGKDLMMNYRQTALRVVEKLNALEVEEEEVGACWKRVSTSLSALFAYEKELEHTRFGTTSDSANNAKLSREKMPYRKVSKSSIDDALRVMARQKVDRSMIPLRTLKEMLAAYLTDLNTIEPSVDVYTAAMQQFVSTGYRRQRNNSNRNIIKRDGGQADTAAHSHLRNCNTEEPIGWAALAASAIGGVKHHALQSFGQGNTKQDPHRTNDRELSKIPWEQEVDARSKLLVHETILRQSITTMCRATPFRLSRMIWHYWNAECVQCTLQQTASSMLRTKVDCISQESISSMLKRHAKEEKDDNAMELELLKKLISIGSSNKLNPDTIGKDVTKGILTNTEFYSAERSKEMLRDKALEIGKQRLGRWNSTLANAIMEAIEIKNSNLDVDGTTKELMTVRKYADGLRENLDKCKECIKVLTEAMTGRVNVVVGNQRTEEGVELHCDSDEVPRTREIMNGIQERRIDFFNEFRKLLSATFINDHDQQQQVLPKRSSASKVVLLQAGIDITDPFGWVTTKDSTNTPSSRRANDNPTAINMETIATKYMEVKDAQVPWLLSSLHGLIDEYYQRIDVIEGYIYMELVGIKIEKHFSDKRTSALALFEKKADITSAMNVASRKRLPKLISELQGKLTALGPDASQTAVRDAKEAHLESKNIKTSLHNVATRRLTRARECSTERVVQILSFWAKEEEIVTKDELHIIRSSLSTLESGVAPDLAQLEACGIIG